MNILVTHTGMSTGNRMSLELFALLGWGTVLLPDQETHDTIIGMCLLSNLPTPWVKYRIIGDDPMDNYLNTVEIVD